MRESALAQEQHRDGVVMKARARLTIIILALVTVLCAVALFGCTTEKHKEGSAERIQVEDTHVYLSPEGEPSTYKLNPAVHPIATASQKVYYRLADSTDREFLEISADGVLKARKLKQDEEGNNLDIIVTVISAENSKVTLNVTVTIEIVEVQRISFNPSTITITLNSAGADLAPIFYPAHALTGRNVIYTSLDPSVATVNATGHVTPVGIGVCSIWVETPKTGAFDEQVKGHVTINVTYTKLDYRLDLTSPKATLNQIAGEPEPINFTLSQLDSFTDPNPTITWYVNNTTINQVGVKDSKVLTYIPSTLPVGEYRIRAVLSNIFETQELVSDTIKIYSPLTELVVDVINNADDRFTQGDALQMLVTFGNSQYPPESYNWTIVKPSGKTERLNIVRTVQDDPNAPKPDFYYNLEETGTYTIQAEAVVKGKPSGIKSERIDIDVKEAREGSDISGVYFDGATVDGVNYSVVKWKALPYDTDYQIEIVSGDKKETLTSTGASAGYFGYNYFRVPTEIATLDKEYSVRIKGLRHDYGWSEWFTYGGDIPKSAYRGAKYDYFEEIAPGINGYIANMEEYGELINYLTVFRPESLLSEGSTDRYRLNLFVPFTLDDLDKRVYPVYNGNGGEETEAGAIDAFKVFATAVATYVESASIAIDILDGATLGGAVSVTVSIKTDKSPSQKTEYVLGEDDEYIYKEVSSVTNFAKAPRGENASLPIDKLTRTMEVTTSNELYLAVSMGYRPEPKEGSVAESVYAAARQALCSIIADGMTTAQKTLAIYEWLSVNVCYDYKIAALSENNQLENAMSYNSFYLEGVFFDHIAVCDGIAKAYSLMCGMEGIANYKIVGVASGVGHAWNSVLIGGKWYIVDATWSSLKQTIGSGSDTQNIELLTRAYYALGEQSVKGTRITYGVYPEIEEADLGYAYCVPVSSDYDSYIESDQELTYYVSTHLYNYLDDSGEIWAEICIDAGYFMLKGGYGVINDVIRKAVPQGAAVELYREGEILFIHFKRS